jgi:multidrug efflux system outer membrane protein
MEPRYRAPPLPVAQQWPHPADHRRCRQQRRGPPSATQGGTEAATAASVAAWDIGWRDFFADPRLQQLIAQALANNRDLRVAVLNIQLARAQYRVQRANCSPRSTPPAASPRKSCRRSRPGLPYSITESFYQVGRGGVEFELDLFGRVRSLTHAALEQYLAQEQARRSAQLSLIAQIANAYLTLASDRELQRLAQQTLKSQEDSFGLTRSATRSARSRRWIWRRPRPRWSRRAPMRPAMTATSRRTSTP